MKFIEKTQGDKASGGNGANGFYFTAVFFQKLQRNTRRHTK
jgi:hypothetical protein